LKQLKRRPNPKRADSAQVRAANLSSRKRRYERVKKLIEQHSVEIDPKDKKKRARILRLLDTLYEEGVKKHNIAAIREYLVVHPCKLDTRGHV